MLTEKKTRVTLKMKGGMNMRYSEEIYNKVFPREDETQPIFDSAVSIPLDGDTVIDNDSTEDDTTDDTVESDSELE